MAASRLGREVVLPRSQTLVVGCRRAAPPYLVAAATAYGVPPECEWFLTLGRLDQLSRNAFHLFEPASAAPAWVLKFGRVRGYRERFERDERGLQLAAAEPTAAEHAPRLVATFDVEDVPASLETAASGELLQRVVYENPREALAHVERVAAWLVRLAAETRAAPDSFAAERDRLLREVIPAWRDFGAEPSLVDRVSGTPPVLQHNDLSCWNIVVRGRSFVVLDWESACRHGLPLWDLAYFLTDALRRLDRARIAGWQDFVLSLFRGESPRSPWLFSWIRKAVEAGGVPAEAVGSVLALGWMQHGLSHERRAAALRRESALGYAFPSLLGKVAPLWLTAPGLGPDWKRWQEL